MYTEVDFPVLFHESRSAHPASPDADQPNEDVQDAEDVSIGICLFISLFG